jgi:transposase
MAIVQLRNPGPGRDYFDRRRAEGKSSMEAMRALKRRLSDIVYRLMLDDAVGHPFIDHGTGPDGQQGNDSDSSATGSQPQTSSSDQPLPDPSSTKPRTPLPAAS